MEVSLAKAKVTGLRTSLTWPGDRLGIGVKGGLEAVEAFLPNP